MAESPNAQAPDAEIHERIIPKFQGELYYDPIIAHYRNGERITIVAARCFGSIRYPLGKSQDETVANRKAALEGFQKKRERDASASPKSRKSVMTEEASALMVRNSKNRSKLASKMIDELITVCEHLKKMVDGCNEVLEEEEKDSE
jgi:hypothetical protein